MSNVFSNEDKINNFIPVPKENVTGGKYVFLLVTFINVDIDLNEK